MKWSTKIILIIGKEINQPSYLNDKWVLLLYIYIYSSIFIKLGQNNWHKALKRPNWPNHHKLTSFMGFIKPRDPKA
jgi:hypothetical protein